MKPTIEQLEDAMRSEHERGMVETKCPKCGDPRDVEPDASRYPCWRDGCDGKISSPLVLAGLI